MLKLQVITVSTRPGRQGPLIAEWFQGSAHKHGKFEIEQIDLATVNLPLYDEPRHPRLRQYEHAHTKRWSALVERGDAYVFVTPEYNYGAPPSLVNALDFVSHEWAYKPVGFVSYGGMSAGTRSVQMAKQIATALKLMAIPEAVGLPMFHQHLDKESGKFRPGEPEEKAARTMLDELLKWAEALKPLHAAPLIGAAVLSKN